MVAAGLGVLVGLGLVGFDVLPGRGTPAPQPTQTRSSGCTDEERATLRVSAAPEIAPALRDLAVEASAMEESLRCVAIDVTATPPDQVRAALARGWTESSDGPAPHVWVPTTSTEVALASATESVADMLEDDTTPIARSPSVIAMPQPMADVLGWPDTPLTWDAVAKLSAADDAWAQRDQPDWGAFKLSFVENVDAEPSISAVAALTRAVGALPAPGDAEASEEQLFQARAQLLLLERKVEYLGTTTGEQLEEVRAADDRGELLQTLSALPLTEQMVWRYNGGADGSNAPDTPLSVWYPADGSPDADYPYTSLDASWTTPQTDLAAGAFLEHVLSDDGQQRLRAAGFRDGSRESTPELIEARGMRPDLAPPEPEPLPSLIIGPLVQSWRGLSQTGNLLAVVDVSGSMATEVPGTGATRLELSKGGLVAGVRLLDPATRAGVWEFSTNLDGGTDHRVLVPLGKLSADVGGRSGRDAAIAAIRSLRPREDTGLYDTVAASYEYMLEHHRPGRVNAVIFFTDGKNDDDDGLSLNQLQDRLRELVDPEREVLFLGVGYGPEADFEALNAVTTITDGKLYALQRPEDIREVFIDVQTGDVR